MVEFPRGGQPFQNWSLMYLMPAFRDERQVVEGPVTPDGQLAHHDGPPNPSLIALDAAKFHKTQAVLHCL